MGTSRSGTGVTPRSWTSQTTRSSASFQLLFFLPDVEWPSGRQERAENNVEGGTSPEERNGQVELMFSAVFSPVPHSFHIYVRRLLPCCPLSPTHLLISHLCSEQYISAAQTAHARKLHERIRREFPELRVYRFWDRPVGPHPVPMFEVCPPSMALEADEN